MQRVSSHQGLAAWGSRPFLFMGIKVPGAGGEGRDQEELFSILSPPASGRAGQVVMGGGHSPRAAGLMTGPPLSSTR